jgi:cob(I)alamin adenosyltransferase
MVAGTQKAVRRAATRFDMVVLNRIYTRTGDEGSTMLGNGEYRKKYDLRVDAYGTVDEVTAAIGVARLHTRDAVMVDAMLGRIQNDLFDLAADLCSPDKGKGPGGERLAVNAQQITRLEGEIDLLNAELAPLRTFVLAGGTPAAAYLHLARTICRRAERVIVELKDSGEDVSAEVMSYINRLSDFLFVASRYLNDKGARDVLWVPGANR